MARRRVNTTKYEIIQVATKMILEEGYSATTPKAICDKLDISTGNLTYYFPTKEHMLAVLVKMLCDFQWKTVQDVVNEGNTSLLGVCLEFMAIASACEESEVAKDFFHSSYTSPMCLQIIRKNDTRRAKQVFGEYCAGWSDEQFAEAEILISGIEYATLMSADEPVPLETRISVALDNIMKLFHVPEQVRKDKITKVLSLDYRKFGLSVLEQFKQFVEQTNEHVLEELLTKVSD